MVQEHTDEDAQCKVEAVPPPIPSAGGKAQLWIDAGMGLAGDMFSAALIASGAPEDGVLTAMKVALDLLGGGSIKASQQRLDDGTPARRLTVLSETQTPLPIAEAPELLEQALRTCNVRGGYAGYAQRALAILCLAERKAHRLGSALGADAAFASLTIVGTVHTPYRDRAPYQAEKGEPATGAGFYIDIAPGYTEALSGLDLFSHLFVLSHLQRSPGWGLLVRPPWRSDERLFGLFATRSPNRPSPIGLTRTRILSVEGDRIHTGPLDLFDDTPVLDIKPYIQSLDGPPSGEVTGPEAANDGWLAGSDHLGLHSRGIPHEHPGGGQLHEAQHILLHLTASAWALQSMNADLEAVRCLSPIHVGGGTTSDTSHGRLSVPAPATRAILAEQGIPFREGPVDAELLTPTGAAILAALSPIWTSDLDAAASGMLSAAGLGHRTFGAERPNAVRLHWPRERANL